MLDGSPYTESFIGGDVLRSFLSGSDYHRWHAPIAGKVLEARVIAGLMFNELLSEGLDISAGTESQGYEAMVSTRGLVVIENPAIGKVAVVPIGITEISSVTLAVKPGDEVAKGAEIGWFSYGGSSLALVFGKGMVKRFTARVAKHPEKPPVQDGPRLSCEAGLPPGAGKGGGRELIAPVGQSLSGAQSGLERAANLPIVQTMRAPARSTPLTVPLIFDFPARRCSQLTGTSAMRSPRRSAWICISTVQPQVRSCISSCS